LTPISISSHPHVPLPTLFFYTIRPRPPTSTLFPYTTLFRSHRSARSGIAATAFRRTHMRFRHRTDRSGQGRSHLQLGETRHTNKDRKSTRLNSSLGSISYAVFCLKKKKKK